MRYNDDVGSSDAIAYIMPHGSASARPTVPGRFAFGGSSSMGGNRWKLSLPDRFWQYVDKRDGCWLWTGGGNHAGYGSFYVNGRKTTAHRVAYALVNGPIPEGHVVRHKCDNPPCVNPAHLETGTPRENVGDTIERRRFQYGSRHWTNRTQRERDAFGRWRKAA